MIRRIPLMFAPVVFLLLAASLAIAGGEQWISDLEVAKEKARREGKDLLLDFTGSDWCIWCFRLRDEVFSQEPFKRKAPEQFVLVEIDFPKKKVLPARIKKQNARLAQEFAIEGYPTIFLTDAQGRAYGKTGYQRGGAEKYMAHLGELRNTKILRDQYFARAEKAHGVEKARQLDAGLSVVEHRLGRLIGYDPIIQQIIELDADNQAGLKTKYQSRKRLGEISRTIDAGRFDQALQEFDQFVAAFKPTGQLKQRAYFLKAIALYNKRDMAAMINALQIAHDAAPNSEAAGQIEQLLQRLRGQ